MSTTRSTRRQAGVAASSVARASAVGPWTQRLLAANVVAQVVIVVTGGLVRLTGSGLGCPTWPECTDGSLVPLASQPEGFHRFIEFGNRTLTFVLIVIALASFLAVTSGWWGRFLGRDQRRLRGPLVVLAGAVVGGIVVQAVLGGISVLLGLNPAIVAAHFLVSMALIAVSFVLYVRSRESGDGTAQPTVRAELRWLARVLVVVAAVVLTLGTVVTGSGPHSGDAAAVVRFQLDPRLVSWLHADVVIAFVGLIVAFWLGARLSAAPSLVRRRALLLLSACALQAMIGYTQYFLGVPTSLVAMHMLGACLVWIASWGVLLSTRSRESTLMTDSAVG